MSGRHCRAPCPISPRKAPAVPIASAALLMSEQPSLDAGEMTDKGSINQRAVLTRRAKLVEELYAPASAPHIIDVTGQ